MTEEINIKSQSTAAKKTSRARKLTAPKPATAKSSVATKLEKPVPAKGNKKAKDKLKPMLKVVRDSFTMPQSDYSKIAELKQVCQKEGLYVQKSVLLRAGLRELSKLSTAQLKKLIAQIEHVKTGRPKKI